jgi:hypothetical protein
LTTWSPLFLILFDTLSLLYHFAWYTS